MSETLVTLHRNHYKQNQAQSFGIPGWKRSSNKYVKFRVKVRRRRRGQRKDAYFGHCLIPSWVSLSWGGFSSILMPNSSVKLLIFFSLLKFLLNWYYITLWFG